MNSFLRLACAWRSASAACVGQRLAAGDVEILVDQFGVLFMMMSPFSETEAAAEGADERDVEREGARLEIGHGTAVGVERVLGAQDFEIGREAAAIARLDQVVGALRRRQRGAGLGEPHGQRALAGGDVGDLADRLDQRLVVGGDGAVEIGARAAIGALRGGRRRRSAG